MASFPQVYAAGEAPQNVLELTRSLVPRLLEGDDPVHTALRDQFALAHIAQVELSGAGFFVTFGFDSPPEPITPSYIAGGDAHIVLEHSDVPAGCVLFVRDGQLSMLEVYMFEGAWTAGTGVATVDFVMPIPVSDGSPSGAT